MNRKTFKINRTIAVMLLSTLFTFAFVWTHSLASEQSNNDAETQKTTVKVEDRPLVTDSRAQGEGALKRFGDFKISSDAATGSTARVAAAADFDADGVTDLLVAYDDRVVLQRGNINAFAPQNQADWEAIRDGRFVSPFVKKARSTNVPVAADFIFSGDFNRDGKLDAAFAARNDNSLYVLEGDGAGNFSNLRRIETAGAITALAAGDVNRADGLTDLIVGTSDANGFGLQIFSGLGDIFAAESLFYNLPSQAEAIAVGQLNENDFNDIAVGTDSEIIILSGVDSAKTGDKQIPEMLRLPQPAGVKSIVVGDLMPDRDNRAELGVLSPDGTIRILARGWLDTRPVSVTEHLAEQVRDYQAKGYPVPKRILARLSKADLRKPRPRPQGDVTTWAEAETVTTAAPNLQLSPQSVLTTGRISGGAADDLIALDQSGKVLVMPFQPDYSGIDRQNTLVSFDGKRATQEFQTDAAPVAALALKLNYDNEEDLLVLKEGGEESAFISAPTSTYTVTTAVDDIDNNLGNDICGGPSGCTLRAAIMEANRHPGNDTIMINAGINPTISRGQPDNDAGTPNDQATGDLDITCVISDPSNGGCDTPLPSNVNNLSIIGAAGGNTVSAGTFTPYTTDTGSVNTDRVFDVGQDGIFGGGFGGSTGLSVTFTNLTIQNGNVRQAVNTNLGAGNYANGGGIRYDGFGNGFGTLTLTNTTVNNDQADNAGGGVYQVYGTFSAGTATFSSNICKAGEGGGVFFGAATSNSNVSITGSSFTANEARQGNVFSTFTANADGGGIRFSTDLNTLSITNTNFTNNIAQQDGGAIKTLNGAATVTGGTMTGNTARRHGGVNFGDQDTAGGARFLTFSGSTMQNNLANSDNATPAFDNTDARPQPGDGGAIFRDRGVLNLTNCVIGGTSAGQPNTATDGGGVAHFFTVDSASGNTSNQTTITINGGSINGNVANTDGGGVYFNPNLFDVTASTLNIGQTTATAMDSNKAKNNGGGINVSNAATANLKNMVLRSNQANSDNSGGGDGGALYQDTAGTTTSFTGTLTIGGSTLANSAVNGGGIRNNAGTVNIPSGASITFNTATGTGGGISNAGTLSALATPTITNNSAAGNGGGIFNSGTLGAITTPTLNSNSAATGGGVFSSSGSLSITGGAISGNTAVSGKGGGIEHGGSAASTVSGVSITNNTGSGILITGTGSLDAKTNTITGNSGDGIGMTGTGTGGNFESNAINNNGELGIDLSDNGVTPNDAGDADAGPNNLQNFPVLNYVRRGDGIANVTLNSAPGKYRVQYYKNAACDASGFGEGEVFMTSEVVTVPAGGTLTYNSSVALAFDSGTREQITATATSDPNGNNNFDDDGSTSEFSQCRKVNTLPTFSSVGTPSRQQGSPSSNSQIATVADPDQTANTLVVTVNGGSSATVNGVTVSNIAVDASGNVTADIVASCGATNAAFTLRVTDSANEFNQATLNVAVTANTAPTVGNYPNTTVNAGSSGTVVTPDAAPTDNGSIASVTASAPGFTGTFVGNTTTGAVTINNAAPAGTYTVTVVTTDNCGVATNRTFTLTVNAIPTITAQSGVTRQSGSPSANSQIATVNDADQSANTLVVTIRPVGGAAPGTGTATVNGVTVSNIQVSAAGVVTADVVAACGATTPANFTLRVTDSNGAFNEATLSVTVTANTAPTVGTYANTTLLSGGNSTVTPTAAPADNGSVASASASAPGFTGTLSVNSTTGVVTVTNANPPGVYTVTVSFTDNCGLTTTRTFTLTVTNNITWTGATSIDWHTASNWNPQFVPNTSSDVTIPTGAIPNEPTISAADVTVNSLIVATGRTLTLSAGRTLTVTGSFTVNGTFNVAGAFTAGTFTPSGTVNFTGTGAQTIPAATYNNLTVNNAAGVTLAGATTVSGALSLQTGIVNAGANILTFSVGATATRAGGCSLTDCFVYNIPGNGGVLKQFTTPATSFTFPVGTSGGTDDGYSPVALTNAVSLAGTSSLTVRAVDTISPALSTQAITRYWQLTEGGNLQTDMTFTYLAADASGISDPTQLRVLRGTTNVCAGDCVNEAAFTGSVANVTTFSPWTIAAPVAPTAATVEVGGRLVTAGGRAIGGAIVSLTDGNGQTRKVTSNQLGYFEFTGVEVGDCVITAKHRSYTFGTNALNVFADSTDLVLIGQPNGESRR